VFPLRRVTVNLAPGTVRKEGAGFDLGLALAVLAATGQVPADRLARFATLGELALDARLRPARGAIVAAEAARSRGLEGILCPPRAPSRRRP
jgi:magnesium chelatase family protein